MWPELIIIPASGERGIVGLIGSTAQAIPAVAMLARHRVGMFACMMNARAAVRTGWL